MGSTIHCRDEDPDVPYSSPSTLSCGRLSAMPAPIARSTDLSASVTQLESAFVSMARSAERKRSSEIASAMSASSRASRRSDDRECRGSEATGSSLAIGLVALRRVGPVGDEVLERVQALATGVPELARLHRVDDSQSCASVSGMPPGGSPSGRCA